MPTTSVSGLRAEMGREVVEQERLKGLLRDLAADDARAEPSARVQRRVMSRWAQGTATGRPVLPVQQALPARRSRWIPARVSFAVASVAAALPLVVWVASRPVATGKPAVLPPKAVNTVPQVKPIPPVVPAFVNPKLTASESQPSAAPRSVAPERVGVRSLAGEAEPFLRLLPMTEQELGTIRLARVRFRDQAARTLGLDARMPAPGIDGFVEADVLLGEDGLARAIRFVR